MYLPTVKCRTWPLRNCRQSWICTRGGNKQTASGPTAAGSLPWSARVDRCAQLPSLKLTTTPRIVNKLLPMPANHTLSHRTRAHIVRLRGRGNCFSDEGKNVRPQRKICFEHVDVHREVSVRESDSESPCEEGGDVFMLILLCPFQNPVSPHPNLPTHTQLYQSNAIRLQEENTLVISTAWPSRSNSLSSSSMGRKKTPLEGITRGR